MHLLIAGLLVQVQLGEPKQQVGWFTSPVAKIHLQNTLGFTARLIRRPPDPRSGSELPH
jgi:hypothetical protein